MDIRDRDRDRDREQRGWREQQQGPQHPHPQQHHLDRTRSCPFLIRTFVAPRDHAPPHAYHGMDGVPNDPLCEEVSIYTWEDATLFELAELVRERVEKARAKKNFDSTHGKRFPDLHFCVVYPDREGKYIMKGLGWVRDFKHVDSAEERRTIGSLGFQMG